MVEEISAGGVVYCRAADGHLRLAILLDKHSNWGLPKGHLDGDETEVEAAHREIAEEIGLTCEMGPLVQRIEYPVFKKEEWRNKVVTYFLARAEECAALTPAAEEGISNVQWVTPETALSMLTFDRVREVVRRALTMLDAAAN
jgi:8-oxo-dGTP pyrophosphatase MutT (NUDIX family)